MEHDILIIIISILGSTSFYFLVQYINNKSEIKMLKDQLKTRPDIDYTSDFITVTHHFNGQVTKARFKRIYEKREQS